MITDRIGLHSVLLQAITFTHIARMRVVKGDFSTFVSPACTVKRTDELTRPVKLPSCSKSDVKFLTFLKLMTCSARESIRVGMRVGWDNSRQSSVYGQTARADPGG